MSNVASRPKAAKPTRGTPRGPVHDKSAETPRAPPSVPEYEGFIQDDTAAGGSAGDSHVGEYTHRGAKGKGQAAIGEEEEGPVRMKDIEPNPEEEEEEAGGEEEEEKEEEEEGAQQEMEKEEPVKGAVAPESAEKETREAFQSAAPSELNEPKPSENVEPPQLQEGEELQVSEAGGEKAIPEVEENTAPEVEEKPAPEVEEKPGPEVEEKLAPEAEEKLAPEAEEQPAPELEEVEKAASEAQPEAEEEAEKLDFTILKNGTVNKLGNVTSEDGKVVGRVTEGILSHLLGKKVDETGAIWSTSGKILGRAEPISDNEREDMMREPAPFESFPDAVVDKDGMVTSNGEIIGRLVKGEAKELRGKSVDADGDILSKGGDVIGKAERWEPEPEPEPEKEPEVDKSILAGKRVNKLGNVVDGNGTIFGRVVEGDVKRMVGRMCDKQGRILSESGDVLGQADLVAEGEREGMKEGPFAELSGCTVAKDGTVVTPAGDVVGRLVSGDPKVLFGRMVDEDGDILDKNGNMIGKAERWEPEKIERKKNPMSGRRVNREGVSRTPALDICPNKKEYGG